jgi:hypothetical protein
VDDGHACGAGRAECAHGTRQVVGGQVAELEVHCEEEAVRSRSADEQLAPHALAPPGADRDTDRHQE